MKKENASRFPWTRLIGSFTVIAILAASATLFILPQTEVAVVTRFGQPVRVLEQPGLYLKWPWPVGEVHTMDGRLVFQDIRISETLTRDKRNVIVPMFAAWRVTDPLRFLEAVGTFEQADRMMENLITSAKNTVLGQRDFAALVSTEPGRVDLAGIETAILATVELPAREQLGLEVQKIGIRRISLPESNTPAVFERMRAERSQFASRFRAEGRRRADEIRVEAEVEAGRLVAEARAYAEERRGQAEAEAARIYREAHAANPAFYYFVRELDTLRQALDDRTTLILETDSPAFRLLREEPGQWWNSNPVNSATPQTLEVETGVESDNP